MRQDTKFEKMFAHIAFGLKEKLSNDEPEQYRTGLLLRQGINMYCALAVQYVTQTGDELKEYLATLNETEMICKIFTLPVREWFSKWDEEAIAELQSEAFWEMEPLIYLIKNEKSYGLTGECLDYLDATENDLSAIDEHKVYNLMREKLSQENYVAVRRLLIENPLLTNRKRNNFLINCNNDQYIKDIFEFAYENIPEEMYRCPNCGWTISFKGYQPQCCNFDCVEGKKFDKKNLSKVGDEFDLRLKHGVARYISYPGKAELEIEDFCKQLKINCELWPEMDRYDIKVMFANGACWGIDVKTVVNPYILRDKIKNDNQFYNANINKGFYVIPDKIIKKNNAYLKICNSVITKNNFRCISMNMLKKMIKKELNNG